MEWGFPLYADTNVWVTQVQFPLFVFFFNGRVWPHVCFQAIQLLYFPPGLGTRIKLYIFHFLTVLAFLPERKEKNLTKFPLAPKKQKHLLQQGEVGSLGESAAHHCRCPQQGGRHPPWPFAGRGTYEWERGQREQRYPGYAGPRSASHRTAPWQRRRARAEMLSEVFNRKKNPSPHIQ